MGNAYLVKINNRVKHFLSEEEMVAAGYLQADMVISQEEFNSNGCYEPRIINGIIVVGITHKEKKMQSILEEIAKIDSQLDALDGVYLTPRIMRGLYYKDEYSANAVSLHEAKAAPLREERAILKGQLDASVAE